MIYSFFIVFFSIYVLAVDCFFYQALPLVVHKVNNTYTAYCPWNDSRDPNLRCKIYKNVMGYCHKDVTPTFQGFLNPLVQRLFSEDHCQHLKTTYKDVSTAAGTCKSYSLCFNLSSNRSMCTCDAGFFGDSYAGCKKHCFSDAECVSPVSHCRTGTGSVLSYCTCNSGYQGDGVMCYKNPCGDDRFEKCGPDRNKVCVPTGPGDGDYKCMVEAGECISFVLNDNGKSIFFHKNSGDSIYVRRPIKNENVFTVFFVLTDEVTAFSALHDTAFGLTKLYSISNTFKRCKFGQVKVTRPNGHEIVVGEDTTEKVEVNVRSMNPEELVGGLKTANILPEKVLEGEVSSVESNETVEAAKPEPQEFLNPALQKRLAQDNCKKIKDSWATSKDTNTVCNKYSFCFNVADDKSLCACQNGFFGDPYTGCFQHCLTDDDCSSPLTTCSQPTEPNQLKRCVCKQGYEGDGVLCHKNICGNDRRAKCGGASSHKVCIPTGSGTNDFACICETGYFLNHKNECVLQFTVRENTVITLVGKNIADGSRVELGDCLSFVINDKTKSIFYHKNSGDSIYVRNDIKNDKQFSIFFIVTKEDSFTNATQQETAAGSPGVSALEMESSQDSGQQTQTQRTTTGGETANQGGTLKPLVEVHVRDLTEAEKSGGLAGHPMPPTMVQIASQDEQEGLEIGSSRAKGHVDPSHLQVSLPPETARQMDL
nr:hypothetical protein MACL_00002592 [Theileria orientalis]